MKCAIDPNSMDFTTVLDIKNKKVTITTSKQYDKLENHIGYNNLNGGNITNTTMRTYIRSFFVLVIHQQYL